MSICRIVFMYYVYRYKLIYMIVYIHVYALPSRPYATIHRIVYHIYAVLTVYYIP